MSIVQTAGPAPKLDAAGQSALAALQGMLAEAARPKPELVRQCANDAVTAELARLAPVAQEMVNAAGRGYMQKIGQAAQAILSSVQTAEASIADVVRNETIRALAQLAPRQVQIVTQQNRVVACNPERKRPGYYKILQTLAAGENVLLVGPAGCGKTTMARQFAEDLGMADRFGFMSVTAGVSESRVVGRFVPVGENGRCAYVSTQFINRYKHGGVMLFDEWDAADPNTALVLNTAFANGMVETPNPDEPIVYKHPEFYCVMAANTWGNGADRQYVGRSQLDAATLDRVTCSKFEIDYDEDFEREVGRPEVVEWVHDLRRKVREGKIRRVVSTRLVISGTRRIDIGHTLDDVKVSYFMDWTKAERDYVGYESTALPVL